MNAIATITRAASASLASAADEIVHLKGRGKAARQQAYLRIAPLSFVEAQSRGESIANLRAALGAAPSEDELKAAQREWTIGRVASRLPATEYLTGMDSSADKLEFVRKLVLYYIAPVAEGSKGRKLRKGELGRRSPVQHKSIRAADEAWSLVKAELGLGSARTLAAKNERQRTRGASANKVNAKAATSAAPAHSVLVKAPAPVDGEAARRYIEGQALSMAQYAARNAGKLPATYGAAVIAFKKAIDAAAAAFAEARDKADAEKAARSK